MNKEPVFEIIPSLSNDQEQSLELHPLQDSNKKKMKFRNVLLNWDNLIHAKNLPKRLNSISPSPYMNRQQSQIVSHHIQSSKISFYAPLQTLVSQIKRQVIKRVTNILENANEVTEHLNLHILDDNLWLLDFDISIRINGQYEFAIAESLKSTSSSFTSLEEIWRTTQSNDVNVQILDVIINLHNKTMNDILEQEYNQFALYRFADHSADWWPSSIYSKCQVIHDNENEENVIENITIYGVQFQHFPTGNFFFHVLLLIKLI